MSEGYRFNSYWANQNFMKTNHQRGFIAKRDSPRIDLFVRLGLGNDFTNGHRGMARVKSGWKKYQRVRERLEGKVKIQMGHW